jgi:hypothetical protein
MKRRHLILAAVVAAMIGVAALAPPAKQQKLLVLDWAARGDAKAPPVAVLIEFGVKDTDPTDYSGSVDIKGAKVVHREGYRFRSTDKLTDDAWTASSHRAIRVPPRSPQVSKMEKIATVGVVLHLTDVKPDAVLTILRKDKAAAKADVALKDVLAGSPKAIWDGAAVVRLITTATLLATDKTEDDFPAACYGPDGTLWVAYIAYTLKDESRRIEPKNLTEQPKTFQAYYRPEFGDQLFVKYYRDGKWSERIAVTGPQEDLVRCAITAKKDGSVHVACLAQRENSYCLLRRAITSGPKGPELSEPDRNPLSGGAASLAVALVGDGEGVVWEPEIEENGKMQRSPAVAIAPNGAPAVAYDTYKDGDYDVFVGLPAKVAPKPVPIASSSKFEARPSICYDPQGRLWIAYEEGPVNWGKDSGALVLDQGEPLYNERSVRVVCLKDGKLFKPVAELPTSRFKNPGAQFGPEIVHKYETATRFSNPHLGIDGKGRVWVTYRQSYSSRYSSIPGSYWLTMARRLDGDKWTEPIEVHHSDGLLDSRPVVLPHAAGGIVIVHNADGRYTTPEKVHNQVYVSYLDLPGEPVEPKLVPHELEKKDPKLVQAAKEEGEAVERMRKYRFTVDGKQFQLLRGEFHRHTEMSWDGGADGSLEDMFRYAIDAASLDWIGNGDHDNGGGREYSWWITQKLTDAYYVKNGFTPIFCYERSVSYPHGHRNCLFTKRGVMTLPRLGEPDEKKRVGGVHADDTKMFYRYLHQFDGICASHTCATGMGTDWRDNDPKVEPVVEIYQGDRNSYEYQEAPRAGHDPKSGKKPMSLGGWQPAGFLDLAFKKGYKLGFQSSSDHWSTHISFCVALADRHTRVGIVDALKKRHSYAATDNIVADVRSGEHMMGDEFQSRTKPALQLYFHGTKPIARIDIQRDSKIVETIKPGKAEYKGEWADPNPEAGVHYYYVRLEQEDGQLVWTSPMWIEYVK